MGFQRHTPQIVLDKEQTLALLKDPRGWESIGVTEEITDDGISKWKVKSQYLCDFMDEMEKDGFVYNVAALRAFEKAHGLEPSPENGSVLSVLVYNAQDFRRHDRLVREGWTPCDDAMMLRAYQTGRPIIAQGENMIGGTVANGFKVRKMKGAIGLYAFRGRERKPFNLRGMPCKLGEIEVDVQKQAEQAVPPEQSGIQVLFA